MIHYHLNIEKSKISDCEEVTGIGEGYEYDLEGGIYYMNNNNGDVVSLMCEANSKAEARRIANEFLAAM